MNRKREKTKDSNINDEKLKNYKVILTSPKGSVVTITGDFSEDTLKLIKENIGKDIVYESSDGATNLRFFMNVRIEEMEGEEKHVQKC